MYVVGDKSVLTEKQFCCFEAATIFLSCRAKDLVSKLLVVDPMQRLSAEAALEHPWLHPDLSASQRPLRLTQANFKQTLQHEPRQRFRVGSHALHM